MRTRLFTALALFLFAAAPASALDLSFTTFSLESGTGSTAVSVWRYDDIAPGVDGLLTLNAFANDASFTNVDGVGSGGAGGVLGEDDVEIELRGWAQAPSNGQPSYGDFTLGFVQADTSNAVFLQDLTMISYDIDSSNGEDYSDTLWILGADSIFFENPTDLQVIAGTGDFAGYQQVSLVPPFVNQGGASSNDPAEQMPVTVFFTYDNVSEISWRWGLTGTVNIAQDDNGLGRRMFLSGNAVFVPEPGTAVLMGLAGIAGLAVFRRRSA